MVRGKWSTDEDSRLIALVNEQIKILRAEGRFIPKKKVVDNDFSVTRKSKLRWKIISAKMGTRSSKQCRERWTSHLSPSVSKAEWTTREDDKLLRLLAAYPGHWALVARQLKGRTQNQVKTRWRTLTSPRKRKRDYKCNSLRCASPYCQNISHKRTKLESNPEFDYQELSEGCFKTSSDFSFADFELRFDAEDAWIDEAILELLCPPDTIQLVA